jgi:phosphoglycolate phosphatase
MKQSGQSFDWNEIELVVFDVDGTLYDQRRLRLVMLRQLLADAWQNRSLDTIRTLRTFRQVREALGDASGADFMHVQYAQTAGRHEKTIEEVRALTTHWLEERPLPHLLATRYAYLPELFAALRANRKRIAVFSDYPATDKLAALGLEASPVVCATDADIACLKPNPLGLLTILKRCNVLPQHALMIGDRFDRDALAATRAGVRALIRTSKPHPEIPTFTVYNDRVFQPLFAAGQVPASA